MSDAINELKKIVAAIYPLAEVEMDAFAAVFQPYTAKRKEMITLVDTKERYLYFVTGGVQRIYFSADNGKEATIIFTYPYSFGGVLDSFMLQQPSKYNYETITASEFVRASYSDLQKVRNKYPPVEVMLNIGISLALSGVLERLAEIQSLGSEEKLRRLFQRSPHIFRLIPQKYLADYLGIDASNFSKFMNNVRL